MQRQIHLPKKKKGLFSMNKAGVLNLNTVGGFLTSILVLAVVAIAVFLALVSLQNANLFATGSAAANNTNFIINNVTAGTTAFFTNVPTIFTILGAVVIITAVTLIILVVVRFSSAGGNAGSGGGGSL